MTRVSADTTARLRKFGADQGNTALAGIGAGLAGIGSPWAVPVLALAIIGVAARLWFMRRLNPTRNLLGNQPVQRAVIGSAVGVALAELTTGTGAAVAAGLGVLALVGAVMYEPYLRKGAAVEVPVVANLPGVAPGPRARDVTLPLVVGDLSVAAVGLLIAATGSSPWWWLLVVPVPLLARLQVLLDSRRRAIAAARIARQLPKAVAAYAPEFAIYTSWPADASHHVTMWLPYLQRTGRRCMIVTRHPIPAAALAKLVDVPVIEARVPEDLDPLIVPTLRAAFYPNASSGNGLFVRYKRLTHVFLGHGDSDKPTSYNPTHAMYDVIFSAGPAAIRRYAEHGVAISPDKFRVVGRPQVEDITPATGPIAGRTAPVVLFAPTWRGHVEETALSSLPMGERIIGALLDRGATVIFRPHPYSYDYPEDAALIRRIHAQLAADRSKTGRAHLFGAAAETERSVVACANAADALISDVSSVVSDFLFSGKPIGLVAVATDPDGFRANYPIASAAYVIDGALSDLDAALDQLLGADPLVAERAHRRADYLGPFPSAGYASAFTDAATAVLDAPPPDRDSEDSAEDAPSIPVARPARGPARKPAGPARHDDGDADEETEVEETGVIPRPTRRGRLAAAYRTRWARYRRLLAKDRRFSQAGSLLALLALFTAMLELPAAVPAVLALLAVVSVYWSVQRLFARSTRWSRLLGESSAARAVVAVTAGEVAGLGAAFSALLVVLVVVVPAGEPHIRKCWGRVGAEVRNFPAAHVELTEPIRRGLVPVASFAVTAVLVPLAALGAGLVALVLVLALVVLYVAVVVRAFQRAEGLVATEGRLVSEITRLAPEFAVYFASSVGAGYQIGMWLPYFARIGRPFIVVTRVHSTLREIAEVMRRVGVEAPIIYRPTLTSLEDVIVPSMRAAFYVNNAVRNTHFIERRELVHVWLNHGDSEKPACYNPVHAIYDLIFVAGQAGIDRYARHGVHIPIEKFRVVGRPQVETITTTGTGGPQPTVLYAPTWQGPYADTRFFSLPQGLAIVERLLADGARVLFRPHPLN